MRAQKCILLVGVKTTLTCTGLQTTVSHVSQYRAENGNLRKLGSAFRHGAVFAPKKCVCRAHKYIPQVGAKTVLTCYGRQTTPSHVRQYTADNENLRNFGSTFHHSTEFAPKKCLSKGSYGYGEPKNLFLSSVQKPHLPVQACKLPRLM